MKCWILEKAGCYLLIFWRNTKRSLLRSQSKFSINSLSSSPVSSDKSCFNAGEKKQNQYNFKNIYSSLQPMDVFHSDYSTGCKNIWIRLLCIKMTVFGNRFLIDVLSSWLTAVHSYFCIKRFLETLFNSFFSNCFVHVVTYYNITHKDKLKGQLRIISIRTYICFQKILT